MEEKAYDINFNTLFSNPKKKCQVNFQAVIIEINSKNEKMSLTIRSLKNEGICYKGLYAIKGEIFPTPKINNIIQIKEIQYKLDDDFNIGLFLKLSISEEKSLISQENNNNILDFSAPNIINELKKQLKITQNLSSNIFIIEDNSNDKYSLRCIQNNGIYILTKNSKNHEYSLKKNNIIYILNYIEDKNNIKLTLISLVEKLTEENLFILLEKKKIEKEKMFIGKIVEINKKVGSIILLNYEKQLFQKKENNIFKFNEDKLEKNEKEIILEKKELSESEEDKYNEIEEEKEYIGLGQFFILTNYQIKKQENDENDIPELKETNNSFIFYSKQNLYFSDKIQLNKLSVIQIYFLDFSYKNNFYNVIDINQIKIDINKPKMNIIIETDRIKNYDYYPIFIQLISDQNKLFYKNKIFSFNLMHGILNKINAFVNISDDNSYFYEYIFYFLDGIFLQKEISIKINKEKKIINIFDNFESSNRLRFNILNIPFQNECKINKLKNSKSLMVCEIFNEKKNSKKLGVFNIEEILTIIPKLKSNKIFDDYYDNFGFILDSLPIINNENEFINLCIKKYNDINFEEKKINFLEVSNYEEEISLSQFKTRIGIIVSYYLNKCNKIKRERFLNSINEIFRNIQTQKNNLSYIQFLRLFKFLIKKKYANKSYEIYFTCELNKYSPYLAAYKFNKEEINNIKELSRLFMGYLQIDSYILTNNLIEDKRKDHCSYSFSLEPLFMLKHHLLQTYEGFFLVESSDEERYAQSITDEKITIINTKKIFEFSNLSMEEIEEIKEPHILKNHAFSLSMEFRHENNTHQKKNQKNIHIVSPMYYFDKMEIKIIQYKKNGKIQGEDGQFIENLIDENRDVIISLQGDIIYGELLDYNLFIQKDFNLLKAKMYEIQKSKNKFGINNNEKNIREIKDNFNSKESGNNSDDEKYFDKIYLNMIKTGTIMISDEEYSVELAIKIINRAKNNQTYEDLPKILIEIDKRMNKKK